MSPLILTVTSALEICHSNLIVSTLHFIDAFFQEVRTSKRLKAAFSRHRLASQPLVIVPTSPLLALGQGNNIDSNLSATPSSYGGDNTLDPETVPKSDVVLACGGPIASSAGYQTEEQINHSGSSYLRWHSSATVCSLADGQQQQGELLSLEDHLLPPHTVTTEAGYDTRRRLVRGVPSCSLYRGWVILLL